jgi:hypothetical protein
VVPVTASDYTGTIKTTYQFAYADVLDMTVNGTIKASTTIASAVSTRRSATVGFTATITNDAQAANASQQLATDLTVSKFATAVNNAITTLNVTGVATVNASSFTVSQPVVTTVSPPPPAPPTAPTSPTSPTPPTPPAVQPYQQISQSIVLGAAVTGTYAGTTKQAFECGYLSALNSGYTCTSGVSATTGVAITSTYTVSRRQILVGYITTLQGKVRVTVGVASGGVAALKAKIEQAAAALGLAGFTVTITTINGATFSYYSSATHGATVGLTALVVAAIAYLH